MRARTGKMRPKSRHCNPVTTVDAENAFDSIQLYWLFLTLQKIGMKGNALAFIQQMYKAPTARIMTPGALSEHIELQQGTQQGCLLSPLHFNIKLEPLSLYLLHTNRITGVSVATGGIRSAMFAGALMWKLEAILHTKVTSLPIQLKNNLLYRDTVVAWREARPMAGKLHICTKHTPIRGNLMFPQGTDTVVYRQWEERGLSHFHHLFHPRMRQFAQLWKSWFLQLDHVFDRTPLDIFLEGETYKISSIYSRFQNSMVMKGENIFKLNWTKDFQADD